MDLVETSRQDRLIDAALELFAGRGVDAASIKEIGRAAGAAPGLIYHYFDSKEALLAAAIERHGFLPELRCMLAIPPQSPAAEVLPQVARGLYDLLTERANLLRVVMARSQTHPEMRQRMEALTTEAQALLAGYLNSRVEAMELRPHACDATARMLLYTVVMWRLADAPVAQLDEAVAVLLDGLTANPSAPVPSVGIGNRADGAGRKRPSMPTAATMDPKRNR
ncbi:MAG TPA: TetR/AcrR family transcriptional regulator [Mycobacteriales bacterium]|jgi:AcrR family transcriptional regulator|nr:TetR/AcrR family transcriptional regulator [Mycobacteriales bacterium]